MLVKTYGAAVHGIDAIIVTIEVSVDRGIGFTIVGLPDAAVRESNERIRTALKHNDYPFPRRNVVINMAPADIKKEGNTITVKRILEDGYMTIKTQTPCLITCIKELNTPRYMSVSGVFEAYAKPMTVLDYNALKDHPLIDPTTIGLKGSPTNILTSFTPPQKGAGQMLEGNDMATCEKLAGILLEKHII